MDRQTDFSRFKKLMEWAGKRTIMPAGKSLDELTGILFEDLEHYPYEAVDAVVRDYCRRSRFFPMLGDLVPRIEATPEDRAALAWSLVFDAAHRLTTDQSVRFPAPAIHFAVEKMGKWKWLCWKLRSDETWLKKDFEQYYLIGEKYGVTWDDVPPYLAGTFTRRVFDAVTGEPVHGLGELAANHQAAELVAMVAEGIRVSA